MFSLFILLSVTQVLAVELTPRQMKYWHKLLHYRPNALGKYVSEVDSLDFFVAANGKRSPKKEFHRFVEILNSAQAQEYVCKFPLRYRWLKSQIQNNWDYTTESCEIYNSFVQKLDAKSLSLVFSSFFINNPGSTFGHTFIRIGRYKEFRSNELLDNAINFAAQEAKDNMVMYMLKGLAGFYPGRFSVVPYYYKIREYNDHEFRDIWDYDLGLNQEQINRVIDHVWEMGNTHFDYYYFTENCSYHVLGLLNVAYDDVDILSGLSPFYVLPIDTIKEMQNLGLVKERKVRVSAYRKLLKETDNFNAKKLNTVKAVALNSKEAQSQIMNAYQGKEQADLLDASISAIDYLKAEKILLNEEQATNERRDLLMLRADNPQISENLIFDEKVMQAPDDAHNSSRLGVSLGDRYRHGTFTNLEWRAAQHDILDPSQGHLKYSQVVMFDTRLRFQSIHFDEQKLILDRFRMVDLKKYQPSDFWNSSVSFDLAAGLDQRRDCSAQDCLNPILTFGLGNSVDAGQDLILSFLFGGSYQYDRFYENDSLLNLGPKLNFLVLKDKFSLGVDASYFMPTELFDGWLQRRIHYDLDLRYFLKRNVSLFFKTNNIDQDVGNLHEAQLGVYFYH
jgi:hypothetical protein